MTQIVSVVRTNRSSSTRSFDDVASSVYMRRRPTDGQTFAQKQRTPTFEKCKARTRIYNQLAAWSRSYTLLTLPGLNWEMEHRIREHRREMQRHTAGARPQYRIQFVAFERDPAIFRAALKAMPTSRKRSVAVMGTVVRTPEVRHFECRAVEDAILENRCPATDAAWLDFTGMLTEKRLVAIRKLWHQPDFKWLAVTTLKARWDKEISGAIAQAGGIAELIASRLFNARIVDDYEYNDGVPMSQVVLVKTSPTCSRGFCGI